MSGKIYLALLLEAPKDQSRVATFTTPVRPASFPFDLVRTPRIGLCGVVLHLGADGSRNSDTLGGTGVGHGRRFAGWVRVGGSFQASSIHCASPSSCAMESQNLTRLRPSTTSPFPDYRARSSLASDTSLSTTLSGWTVQPAGRNNSSPAARRAGFPIPFRIEELDR